ncbi:autotransporter domain-containing protein [Chelativorans salis]|uniref:Autotransporter domain-containing protein n=1 Tax=Chelativorans salis TaxID=2978478 RepID=A0ABT2LZ76_9HYPH|nr:autotransporter domain-containing protein [Chelativorans sp. EGI FJ00035]MCT7378693.1 autotransporter domain-containing protein [Chelativorans sp. EGI FJ00035]
MKSLKTRDHTTGKVRERALWRALAGTTVLTGVRITGLALATAAVGVAAVTGPARADLWTGAVSDDWFVDGNWLDGSAPTAGDFVYLNSASFNPVILSGGSVGGITQFRIGLTSDGTGDLTIESGGALSGDYGVIGSREGSIGVVTVTGPTSAWTNTGDVTVGFAGNGTLTIEDQGTVANTNGLIGYFDTAGGNVTVSGAGSIWTNSGDLFVGREGHGTLTIENQGTVTDTNGFIGRLNGSTGNVTVSGAGSTWTNSTALVVGDAGTGTLTVLDGGTVSSNSSGFIGFYAGSSGAATVTGLGSTWTNSTALGVGVFGEGLLMIENGGAVSNSNGAIGLEADSFGTVTVTGAGSTWTNSGALFVGDGGAGMLTVSDGGTVSDSSGYIGVSAGSSGTATVTGPGSTWTNGGNLEIGGEGDGTLTIADGGTVSNAEAYIGHEIGSIGEVTVTGRGSSWNPRDLIVGSRGNGALTVEDGGGVNTAHGVIGDFNSGTGTAVVTGSGSTLTSSALFFVGGVGEGTLTVEAGGAVDGDGSVIGYAASSLGMATVTGPGSTWANTGGFYVGYLGEGMLTIADGGVMDNVNGYIGYLEGSSGNVTVSDANSSWINSGSLTIGREGSGTLTIADGGTVNNANQASIGDQVGSSGTATVTGPASTWTSSDSLFVGGGGDGTLTVENGGAVTSNGGIIGLEAGSTGSASVAGSDSTWTNTGFFYVGYLGDGGFTIEDGGTVSNRGSAIGLFAGSSGTATVSGSGSTWTVDGNLHVGLQDATGTLLIEEGGTVSSDAGTIGNNSAGAAGMVTVTGAGSTWRNSGSLTVGGLGKGTLTIAEGATLSSIGGSVGSSASGQGNVTLTGNGTRWESTAGLTIGDFGAGELTIADQAVVNSTSAMFLAREAGSRGVFNIGAAEGDPAAAPGTLNTTPLTFGDGDGRIVFNHTADDYTFVPGLIGTGRIDLLAGNTEINNAFAFSGATTVHDSATFVANGTLGGILDVLAGGRLRGAGAVGTTTMAGSVAPGNSIGTLTVSGDYTQAAGSTYEVEVDGAGNSDLLDVSGTATLEGGTVEVVPLPDFTIDTSYTVLSAAGGVTGTFDDLALTSGSFLFLSPELTYDGSNAYLTFHQAADFASVAETSNHAAAAQGVQSLGGGNALFSAVALLDSAEEARAAFDALSGEVHASAKSALIKDSRFVREAAAGRVRAAFGGVAADAVPVLAYGPEGRGIAPADTERFAAWGQAFGSWGRWDGDGNAAALDRDIGGFFLGADMAVADTWRLGVLTGHSRSTLEIDERTSSASSDNFHLGLYGGTQSGAIGLRGGLAYTWHDIEINRHVAFDGFVDGLEANYDAGTLQAFGEAGYRIDTAAVSFEPFANLAYVRVKSDGFSETGGAAALTEQSATTETAFTTLGLRASGEFDLAGDSLTAQGMIGWRHAFGDTEPVSRLALAGGDAFTITGVPITKDAAVVEFGLDYELATAATLGISYQGQLASGAYDHGLRARLSARF